MGGMIAIGMLLGTTACTSVSYSRTEPTVTKTTLTNGVLITVTSGERVEFATRSFITKKSIAEVSADFSTNSKSLKIKGYSNDQSAAIEAGISAGMEAIGKYFSGGLTK